MIIHIFASRPLNKDKNYIFIVVLSSLSPILLDSIKKQAKNASKRLKIGKSAELFLIIALCKGNGLAEVEENDSNDTLVCDDDAHKVVVCSHGFFF